MTRIMKAIASISVLLALFACSNFQVLESNEPKDDNSTWIYIAGPWVKPPKDPDHHHADDYRSAEAVLLNFAPGGKFSMLHCWIIEHRLGFAISPGDGHAIFLGSWLQQGSRIDVDYQLVYERVEAVGRTYPGPPEWTSAMLIRGKLLLQGKKFSRVSQSRLPVSLIEDFTSQHWKRIDSKNSSRN